MENNEGRLGFKAVLDNSDLNKKVKEAENKFSEMSRSATKAGDAIKASWQAMGGPLLGVIGLATMFGKTVSDVVRTNMQFERKTSELAAVLGTTKDGVKNLTLAAKELGRTTEFTTSEVGDLQIALARLGFSENQIIKMQGSVLKFAAAVGADLGDAADFAGSALRAFGLEAGDTNRLLDIMAASTSKSALNFSKLQTSISIVAPIAHTFGLSVEDTVTFLGALSNAGFDASSAATALRNILLNLADENGALAKGLGHTANNFDEIIAALKECTEKGIDLNAALEMTDKRSVSAFSALISGAGSADELRKALGEADGAMEQMYETMTDNLEGAVKGLSSAWEGFMLSLNNNKGLLKDTVSLMAKLVNGVTDLMTSKDQKIESRILNAIGDIEGMSDEEIEKKIQELRSERYTAYHSSEAYRLRGQREAAKIFKKQTKELDEQIYILEQAQIRRDNAIKGIVPGTGDGGGPKVLSDAEKKAIQKASEALAEAQREMWLKVNETELAAMREGTEKKLRQIEYDRLASIEAINKEQTELEKTAKKAGRSVSPETYAQLEARRSNVNTAAGLQRAAVEKEQADYIANLYRGLSDVFAGEEQKKIDAIKRTYEEQRRQLESDLMGGTIDASQFEELLRKVGQAEQKAINDSWIQSFGNYDQKLQALRDEWAQRMKDVPAEFAEEANKQMNEAISNFIVNNSETTSAITRLFDDMTEKSVKDLRTIAEEAQTLYDMLKSGEWDSSLGEKLGISKEQFDTLRKSPDELEKIQKAIKGVNTQADEADNLFRQMSKGLKEIFTAGDNSTRLAKGMDLLSSGMQKAVAIVGTLQDAFSNFAEGSGSKTMKDVSESLGVAVDAASAAMSGAQAGAAFGPWGAAAGAAIGMVSKLYEGIGRLHDSKIQERIEGLSRQLDTLADTYSRLEERSEEVFGAERAKALEAQNRNLQRQNELIREQIREEESKKNSDEDAISAYQDRIRENNRLIAENKEAAVDALFGSDIKSSIESFADAVASAWENGDKGAKGARDFARAMFRSMVNEAMKSYTQASGAMERIRDAMQDAMLDSVVTDAERKKIDRMAEDLASELEQKYGWATDIYSDKERSAVRGSGIAASQDSMDESNARLTTMQSHTYSLMMGQQELIGTSAQILQKVTEIEENTYRSNQHLEDMKDSMARMKSTIDDISLKGVRIKN